MPTDPLISRIRARTPLSTKVAVAKVFDLAEQVEVALAQVGQTPEWLAGQVGISLDELIGWLGGMHPILDSVAKLEAALQTDLLVTPGKPQGYFGSTADAPAVAFTTQPDAASQQNFLTVAVQTATGEQQRYYSFAA